MRHAGSGWRLRLVVASWRLLARNASAVTGTLVLARHAKTTGRVGTNAADTWFGRRSLRSYGSAAHTIAVTIRHLRLRTWLWCCAWLLCWVCCVWIHVPSFYCFSA